MEIVIVRPMPLKTASVSLGEMYIDGKKFSYTLEDKDRELTSKDTLSIIKKIKVLKKTAIPLGTYEIAMTYSVRFKKVLPLLLNIPGFTGIRIHNGVTEHHTEGCILVGYNKKSNIEIANSKQASKDLTAMLLKAIKKEKIFCTIIYEPFI